MTAGEPTTGRDDEARPCAEHGHVYCCVPAPDPLADNAGEEPKPCVCGHPFGRHSYYVGTPTRDACAGGTPGFCGCIGYRPAASPGVQADEATRLAANIAALPEASRVEDGADLIRRSPFFEHADDGRTEELRHELAAVMERGGSDVLEVADVLIAGPLAPLLAATTGRGDDGAVQRVHAKIPGSENSENGYLGECWCQSRGEAWPCRSNEQT